MIAFACGIVLIIICWAQLCTVCLSYRKDYVQQRIVVTQSDGSKPQMVITSRMGNSSGGLWDATTFSSPLDCPLEQVIEGVEPNGKNGLLTLKCRKGISVCVEYTA